MCVVVGLVESVLMVLVPFGEGVELLRGLATFLRVVLCGVCRGR